MRCVGGPLDGQELTGTAHIVKFAPHMGGGRYVRWWDIPDYPEDWFIRGLPEPEKPERYYLWQPAGEEREHPAVIAIREAVWEAARESE